MTGEGGSAVGRAVAQLTAALGKSDEAQLHGREALARVTDAWALHRFAAVDTEAESMASAVRHGEAARATLVRSIGLLKACDESIVGYVGRIAPGLNISVSGKEATFPEGAALLETSKRPRNLRQANRELARDMPDVNDLVSKGRDVSASIKELFRPPDPASLRSSTEPPGASPPVVSTADRQAVQGDPLLSFTILATVVFEYSNRAIGRILNRDKRRM